MFTRVIASIGVFAFLAATVFSQPVDRMPGPAPADEVGAREVDPKLAAVLTTAIDQAINGKLAIEDVSISGRSDAGEFTLHGGRGGFVGSIQVQVPKDVLVGMLKRIQKADFARMPGGFGGVKRGPGGPMIPDRLVRSLTLKIGKIEKTVAQLAMGEQSESLQELVDNIRKDIEPLTAKGIDLVGLTLRQALDKIAKGEVMAEAMSFSFVESPRPDRPEGPTMMIVIDSGTIRLGIKEVPLEARRFDEFVRKLAASLAAKDIDKMPVQLYAPASLQQLAVQVRGAKTNLNMTADIYPHNKSQKEKNPDAQKAYEQIVAEVKELLRQLEAPASGPATKSSS